MRIATLFAAALIMFVSVAAVPANSDRGNGNSGAASGSRTTVVRVPGLGRLGTVFRDHDGMPHIVALNERDALFIQGWMHAEDRIFQLDVLRRQASGTLAELLGAAALSSDVELRTIGLRRAAERSWEALSPAARTGLEAYAAGVNAWIATHPLAAEYGALEVSQFAPWTPVDSVVVGKALAFSLSFDLDIDPTIDFLTYQATGAALGFDGSALFFEDVFRSAPFDPAASMPDATGGRTPFIALPAIAATASRAVADPTAATTAVSADEGRPIATGVNQALLDLARAYRARVEQVPLLRTALERSARVTGSNEWAVSGRHTRSGRPLVANDPHLSLGAPATFYQNHLFTLDGKLNAIGSSVPGVPWIVQGQNRYYTWGTTTNGVDVTDTYQERIVPSASSPSGLATIYRGQTEAVIPIPQVFRYNTPGDGQADNISVAAPNTTVGGASIPPVTLIVPRRNQGPIVNLDATNGTAISVQYTGFSPTRELDCFRDLNFGRNLDDFKEALQFFDFGSQNFIYGDIRGNIGYFTTAEVPLREDLQANTVNGSPPWFIRDGTGGNEWLPVVTPEFGQATPYAVLPFDELAQTVNPSVGWVVNANNDPAGVTLDNNPLNQLRRGGQGIYYLGYALDFGTRAGRITQALKQRLARGRVSIRDMQAIQADVVMLDAQVFAPYIVQAFHNAAAADASPILQAVAADPRVIEAVGRLTDWDHSAPTGVREGYDADDSDGLRRSPTRREIANSIAATIYSVWRTQAIKRIVDAPLQARRLDTPGSGEAVKALRQLLETFPERQGRGASGIDFFSVPGVAAAAQRRDILLLGALQAALDRLAGSDYAAAFNGSTQQDDYRWGRLHRIVMRSVVGGPFNIPPAGGTFPPSFSDLAGLSVDGGFGVVDASSHSARADSSNAFMFGSGPVRRYVGEPGWWPGSINGDTALPGGASGVLADPFQVNLLGRWLTNDYYPLRQQPLEFLRDLDSVYLLVPAD
ncbi:MAG TPA: penicillin acylase family protein [Steroidobacteraceae bacterium]|nr:penicillin acylase family protein [Steroidobacteraceae bacterium]